jgi:hypothetical protein
MRNGSSGNPTVKRRNDAAEQTASDQYSLYRLAQQATGALTDKPAGMTTALSPCRTPFTSKASECFGWNAVLRKWSFWPIPKPLHCHAFKPRHVLSVSLNLSSNHHG